MKGDPKVIEILNSLLAEELTAISQYFVHAEMYADWGYEELHEALEHRSIEEMKHAEKLMSRILFLEGKPIVSKLEPIHIGKTVPEMLENDRTLEQDAINRYNKAISQVATMSDQGSKELLDAILKDEEEHVDYFEVQLTQIEQMGLQNYLTAKK